ncbi:VOC family protein [Gammaproteobacteria bacterium]|nr:VOC family protein [Gammaproteobacteria bacterium]
MSDKIHHIAIQVDDISTAVEWYTKAFDVEVSYQDESWAMLKFDNISLALVLPGQHPPHFAIANEHAENYGALTPHRDGTASVYIKDPFENAVEIIRLQG